MDAYNSLNILYHCLVVEFAGAAAPDFNSLISAPSVPSLFTTEPEELPRRASNISCMDSFCFVKQKQETAEAFLEFFFTNMRSSSQRADNKNLRR